MFSRFLLLTGFAAILVVPSTATAQGTFTWNFGTTVANPLASSATGSGAIAGSFTIANSNGVVATPISTTNPSGITPEPGSGAFNLGTSVNNAFPTFNVAAPYYQVTLTDSGSGGLQLNDFTFNYRRSTTGALNYSLRSSSDSFASNLLSGTVNTADKWLTQANGTGNVNIGTGTVTLRLYVFNGSGAAASGVINSQIDDVVITYTPVPEPATMLSLSALGLGAVGLVRRIRRTAVVAS